jgi:hypothetical protein
MGGLLDYIATAAILHTKNEEFKGTKALATTYGSSFLDQLVGGLGVAESKLLWEEFWSTIFPTLVPSTGYLEVKFFGVRFSISSGSLFYLFALIQGTCFPLIEDTRLRSR